MMSEILTDLTLPALAKANQANLYGFFRLFERSPAMEFESANGLTHWYSPVPFSWFNGVLASRNATESDHTILKEILAYFKSRGVDEITWWLEENVERESWEAILVPNGFRFHAGPPGMSIELDKLNGSVQAPAGLVIKPVDNGAGMQDCAHVVLHGYEFPIDSETQIFDFMKGIGSEFPFCIYVAYLEEKPVATSAVFYGAGVAGIYQVATLAEARGKGIGAAITRAPLLAARKMGYRASILQSSEMGYNIYKRLGYEENCHLGYYHCKI
jgi:GNAT superfamily N-acetyltransferase